MPTASICPYCRSEVDNGGFAIFVVLLISVSVFLFPGMYFTSVIFSDMLPRSWSWVFASVACVSIYAAIFYVVRNFKKSIIGYCLISLLSLILYNVMPTERVRWGLHNLIGNLELKPGTYLPSSSSGGYIIKGISATLERSRLLIKATGFKGQTFDVTYTLTTSVFEGKWLTIGRPAPEHASDGHEWSELQLNMGASMSIVITNQNGYSESVFFHNQDNLPNDFYKYNVFYPQNDADSISDQSAPQLPKKASDLGLSDNSTYAVFDVLVPKPLQSISPPVASLALCEWQDKRIVRWRYIGETTWRDVAASKYRYEMKTVSGSAQITESVEFDPRSKEIILVRDVTYENDKLNTTITLRIGVPSGALTYEDLPKAGTRVTNDLGKVTFTTFKGSDSIATWLSLKADIAAPNTQNVSGSDEAVEKALVAENDRKRAMEQKERDEASAKSDADNKAEQERMRKSEIELEERVRLSREAEVNKQKARQASEDAVRAAENAISSYKILLDQARAIGMSTEGYQKSYREGLATYKADPSQHNAHYLEVVAGQIREQDLWYNNLKLTEAHGAAVKANETSVRAGSRPLTVPELPPLPNFAFEAVPGTKKNR